MFRIPSPGVILGIAFLGWFMGELLTGALGMYRSSDVFAYFFAVFTFSNIPFSIVALIPIVLLAYGYIKITFPK